MARDRRFPLWHNRDYLLLWTLHQNEVSDGASRCPSQVMGGDCGGHEVDVAPTVSASHGIWRCIFAENFFFKNESIA
jgi:hypothetical protein